MKLDIPVSSMSHNRRIPHVHIGWTAHNMTQPNLSSLTCSPAHYLATANTYMAVLDIHTHLLPRLLSIIYMAVLDIHTHLLPSIYMAVFDIHPHVQS